jgi:hypothetical protein
MKHDESNNNNKNNQKHVIYKLIYTQISSKFKTQIRTGLNEWICSHIKVTFTSHFYTSRYIPTYGIKIEAMLFEKFTNGIQYGLYIFVVINTRNVNNKIQLNPYQFYGLSHLPIFKVTSSMHIQSSFNLANRSPRPQFSLIRRSSNSLPFTAPGGSFSCLEQTTTYIESAELSQSSHTLFLSDPF